MLNIENQLGEVRAALRERIEILVKGSRITVIEATVDLRNLFMRESELRRVLNAEQDHSDTEVSACAAKLLETEQAIADAKDLSVKSCLYCECSPVCITHKAYAEGTRLLINSEPLGLHLKLNELVGTYCDNYTEASREPDEL